MNNPNSFTMFATPSGTVFYNPASERKLTITTDAGVTYDLATLGRTHGPERAPDATKHDISIGFHDAWNQAVKRKWDAYARMNQVSREDARFDGLREAADYYAACVDVFVAANPRREAIV
jgi:hypothetical protein